MDVGRLQIVMERGLARFGPKTLDTRWAELHGWLASVIRAWAQRTKRMRIEKKREGIRIELITQDDRGYYEYAFDVFPNRRG